MKIIDYLLDRMDNCCYCSRSEYNNHYMCIHEDMKIQPEWGLFVAEPCKSKDYKMCPFNKEEEEKK